MVAFAVFVADRADALTDEAIHRLGESILVFCGGHAHQQLSRRVAFFAHTMSLGDDRAGTLSPIYSPNDGSLITGDVRLDRLSALERDHDQDRRDDAVPVRIRHLRAAWWAYRRSGQQVFSSLSGSFSFVIWDALAQRLLAVRDGMGEVPLYVSRVVGGFILSNHLPVLLRSLEHPPSLHVGSLIRRIVGMYPGEGATEYEQIERIPAGYVWEMQGGGRPRMHRYWALRNTEGSAAKTFQENARLFQETFETSVRDRLPAEGSVAVELSGGLDSSSVSGVVAHYAGDRTRTYSAIFPGIARSDEDQFIRSVVRHQGIHNHRFSALELDWASSFDASLSASGRLLMAANVHIVQHIYRLARADGCAVVFNGIDGDNVASHGYYRLAELAKSGRWAEFARQVRSVEDLFPGPMAAVRRGLYGRFCRPTLQERFRRRSVFDPGLFIALLQLSLRLGFGPRWLLGGLINRSGSSSASGSLPKDWFNPDLVDAAEWERLERERLDSAGPFSSEREAMLAVLEGVTELYFEFSYPIAVASGLHIAAPFMDRGVLELCVNMPSEFKLRGAWNRAFMREGLATYMGEQVAWRRWKSDLSFGFAPYFTGVVLPRVRELLDRSSDGVWNIFSHSRVGEVTSRLNVASRDDVAIDARQQQMILAVYTLHRFIELGKHMQPIRG